jgi:hypothetical protein
MVSTKLFDSINAIVTTLQAAGITVIDGPEVADVELAAAVFVGYDADPEGEFAAATLNQDWSDATGSGRRDEQLEVMCCAVVLDGESAAWKPVRDKAKALLTAVETALRADPSLGQLASGTTQYYFAGFRPMAAYQEPTPAGYQFRFTFAVSIKTRV